MELVGILVGFVALAVTAWFDGADSRIVERDETRAAHIVSHRAL